MTCVLDQDLLDGIDNIRLEHCTAIFYVMISL